MCSDARDRRPSVGLPDLKHLQVLLVGGVLQIQKGYIQISYTRYTDRLDTGIIQIRYNIDRVDTGIIQID